ncbi:glycoside hydrolase family 3 N-terminal domain-containing protein [Athalassotoga saccharophila]|uniref:glycoside hydrolase family 3 N-terminal domain-containing protein n=1 Tax=Athalassotoga saccharophila TaxID=1441386 RepID=UPI00137AB8D4|nr:glycoside hydrolase family 3 N-terminal domain-containing protein [Athalassotoga saccharophila]BBJ27298.1 beta-glucosidase [Athalassotoga saccharophila]
MGEIEEILSKMSLDEKIAQIGSVWVHELFNEDGELSHKKMEELLSNGIGQITRVGGSSGLPPDKSVKVSNQIQKFLVEETRLGIPAIVHEECLNGYMAKGATVFPQMIGIASSWNPQIVHEIANVIRQQMRSVGAHEGLAPLLDVSRDPRWGRIEETFGEDVYLVSVFADNYIKALQKNMKNGVMATAKHFVAYAMSEGGLNCAPVHLGERELREVFLKTFEIAVKDAKVGSIMNAYNEIDGVPCAASKYLLTDILRREWKFDGIVVSDYSAIDMIENYHRIAKDKIEAAFMALNAGIDVELPTRKYYSDTLKKGVESGQIPESLIDRSVKRVLNAKLKLGLFEKPFVTEKNVFAFFDTDANRAIALKAARESIVLLKNDGILPLKNLHSIAVVGPNAANGRNMLSDYSYPSHIEAFVNNEVPDVIPTSKYLKSTEGNVKIVSILDGIKEKANGKIDVKYARGCDNLDPSKDGFEEAIRIARESDIVIAVVGDRSGLSLSATTGESRDRSTLDLPGVQEELVEELYKTGKPLVVILVNGRPFSIKWIADHASAIVESWLPGEEGGHAVADVLFGDYNPSGKLPVSFPRNVGQIPIYYSHKPTGGRSNWHGDYVEESTKPLFPFGFGLSYTKFEYSDLRIDPSVVNLEKSINVSFKIKNTGKVAGDEVAQLYINDKVASITRPVKELKGFAKIHLEAGEEKSVTFELPIDLLAFYDSKMNLTVEAGEFEFMIGSSSEDIRLRGSVELKSNVKVSKKRPKFFSTVIEGGKI